MSICLVAIYPTKGQNLNNNTISRRIKEYPIDSLNLKSDSTQVVDSLRVDSTQNNYISEPVAYQAQDSIVVSLDSEKMRMYNESQVKYQQQQINSYYVEVDMRKNIVYSKYGLDSTGVKTGYPVFKDKQTDYEVTEMSYNLKSKKAIVKDIITQEGEGYIQSSISKRVSEDVFYLKNGRYTTCENHDHPHYYIQLKKAKMIKDDKVVTGLANLVIEGVKTPLALPFGLFPLKKHYSSGIIIPTFGEEKTRGFYFQNFGYYYAINDYVDARFNGNIYTNGSWQASVSTNYKKRYKYNGRFNFSYSINKYGDKGLDDYHKATDFSIRWSHSQDSKAHPYRNLSASVNISTSKNDYRNARSIQNIGNTTKQSSISYSRRWPDSPFNLSMSMQHSQNRRDTTISLTLPSVNLSMQTQYPFRSKKRTGTLKWYDKISVGYSARLTNRIHTHEDKLFKASLKKDWRNGFEHNIPIGASYKLARDLTFSTNLNYKAVAYINSIRKSYDPIKDKVVSDTIEGFNYAQNFSTGASVAFTPKFFGMYAFGKESKVQAIRHVISPSLSFSYTPDLGLENNHLFRTYRNSISDEEVRYNILSSGLNGVPTKGEQAGYLSFGIDNNIEMKVRNSDTTSNEEFKKIKLLESFSIRTSYNIFADSMNFSNVSLSGRTSLFKRKLSVTMNGTIDPYAINEKGARINQFSGGLGRLTSAGLSLSTSFNGNSSKKKNPKTNDDNISGGDEVFGDKNDIETFNDINDYIDFEIPWSVRLNYRFNYTKPQRKSQIKQFIDVSGDLSLTKKWKVSIHTNYDISKQELGMTSLSIFRDLHCWEMSFTAIPFGQRQNYSFRIAVKSSLLKDLKYEKRDSWYDNF